MLDRIVIAGAGRTTESLLERLVYLAPVLVLDTSQAALDELSVGDSRATPPAYAHEPHPLKRRHADATSRFVLEEVREDERLSVGLVAATGSDRKNVEICRLAGELGYRPVVGIVIDPDAAHEYEAHGARTIVRAQILGKVVEHALRYDGLVIASTIGQGKGEIIEFVILPSSPAIGMRLSQLQADGWRIAAIYRAGRLVIPMGETVITVEDRLLVVGDPAILPGVAEQLRIGVPQFPLRSGPHVVAYMPRGRRPALEQEAELLLKKTRAASLVRVAPDATPARALTEVAEVSGTHKTVRPRAKAIEDVPLAGRGLKEHLMQLQALRPGVVVTDRAGRSVGQRLLGRGGVAASLCNALHAPVLFARGGPAYGRIVYALVPGIADMTLADTAIDLARLFELPLLVARVALPEYIESPDPQADQIAAEVDRRARFYALRVDHKQLSGNPVRELVRVAQPADLMLIGRRRTTRDSFTAPDLALRVASAAPCSTLVRTIEPT